VATALAIILLSAASLFAVSLFPNALAALSGIVTDHPGYIRATNALAAAFCCIFLLWPRAGSRLVGHWNEYVGWAFFILFIQYVIRLAALFMGFVLPEWEPTITFVTYFVIYPASFLNNILFLVAARILLNKNKGLRGVHLPEKPGVLDHVKYYVAVLWVGVPKWVWLMFLLTLLAPFDNYVMWARFPDAIFSIFCLGWFGYAVRLSLQVRRRRVLAWVSYVLVLSYGAGQLIYALNPVIAYTILDRSPTQSSPARLMKRALWPNVDKVIVQNFKESDFKAPDQLMVKLADPQATDPLIVYLRDNPVTHPFKARVEVSNWPSNLEHERQGPILTAELNGQLSKPLHEHVRADSAGLRAETRALLEDPPEPTTEAGRRLNRLLLEDTFSQHINKMATVNGFLDLAIFALLFPMKYLLFMPAFILYLLSLISVNSFRRALHKTTNIRKDYLSDDGILDVIGQSMDADEVKLLVRLPGVLRRGGAPEERCLAVLWSATKKDASAKEREIFAITKPSLLSRVMQMEGKEIILTNEDAGEEAAELRTRGDLPQTLVLIPIKFHGGVIGALRAVFSGYGKFNDGTLEQLKFMAELVAPSVQDFRTMSAVDKFGVRLSRGQFADLSHGPDAPRTPASSRDFDAAMDELMSMLFDLLNPLCVSLLIEYGFKTSRPASPCAGRYHKILQDHGVVSGPKRTSNFETENGPVSVLEDYLPSSTGKSEQLGKLILIIPQNKDDFDQPTLAAYYLTRLMIASLIANGIDNAARASLAVIIHDLGLALNKETLSYEQWFMEISAASRQAGLLWVIASGAGGSQSLLGRLEYGEIVKGLIAEKNDELQQEPMWSIAHKYPGSTTCHIIRLKLNDDGGGLWLGVGREGFGSELSFNSPWREFLEKLAGIAHAALKSIDERLRNEAARKLGEEARLQAAREAAERNWVEKNNLISVLTFHDLINLVRGQRDTAKAALEATKDSIEGAEEQLRESVRVILNSTKMTRRLIRVIRELTRWDGPLQCSIGDAVKQAEELIQLPLDRKRIKVKHHDEQQAVVGLPQYVGTLVIASLLRNAVDASDEDGTITIHTEVANGAVSCNVLNNGKPVSDDDRKKLGEMPLASTEEHNGWSLFVIPRLLQKFDGKFQLLYSNDSGTCFTLQLPISKG
jgi:signal transduction histidine kinase